MKTEVFKLTGNELDQYLINIAGGKIRSGGLVAFPTETVYGLGANALDREAVNRIFKAKGRPFSDPLIVHICNIKQLEILTITLPLIAWQLAEAFWPGPLTLVLHRNAKVPSNISAERDSIAIRFPAHPVAQMLIKQSEVPIAAPSANRFMRPSPTTAQHVIDDLDGKIDIILDGGACPIGVESTVVDLLNDPPVILRPGGIPLEKLKSIIPNIAIQYTYNDIVSNFTPSPGMLTRHYSPESDLFFISGNYQLVQKRIYSLVEKFLDQGKSVGLLLADEDVQNFIKLPVTIQQLGPRNDLNKIAANLYSALRALDASKVDVILVGDWSLEGLGLAIRDRLIRASGGQIIDSQE